MDFVEQLKFLEELYSKANAAIILLENYNAEQDSYLALHNELRSALNHIMRMVKHQNEPILCWKEFQSASSHMWRAGYDAYELLCIDRIEFIINNLSGKYSTTDIRIGLPDYYERIRPAVENIKLKIADIRTKKEYGEIDGKDAFDEYFAMAEQLIGYANEILAKKPSIDACYVERRSKDRRGLIINIIINAAVAAAFFLLGKIR